MSYKVVITYSGSVTLMLVIKRYVPEILAQFCPIQALTYHVVGSLLRTCGPVQILSFQ